MELFERKSISLEDTDKSKEVKLGVCGEGYLCLVGANTIHLQQTPPPAAEFSLDSNHFSFLFSHEIDCVVWAGDESQMLIVGDRAGQLHFVSPETKSVFFSQALVSNDEMGKAVFADLQFHNGNELLVLMTNGSLTVCNNLSPQVFQSALKTKSEKDFLTEMCDQIQLRQVDVCGAHNGEVSSLLSVTTPQLYNGFISTGSGPKALCVWRRVSGTQEYESYDSIGQFVQGLWSKVIRSGLTSCGTYLITLSDSGVMCLWLLSSLIMINIWAESKLAVRDFALFRRNYATAGGRGQVCVSKDCETDGLCVITEGKQGQVKLQLVSLPSLEVYYSLEVSPASQLFHGQLTEDTLFYLDFSTSSVEVVQLVQALPENKLASLLLQQKFTEAEAFVVKYGMDPEIVLKSIASHLNKQLSAHTNITEATDTMESFQCCLDKIQDQGFITDIIFEFSYQSLEVTMKMLLYANKKIKDPDIIRKIKSMLNRLTTYQIIHRNGSTNSQSYLSFLNCSPVELLQTYLCRRDIQSACCIHNRHMGSLVRDLGSSQLLSVVRSVPEVVDSDILGQFMSRCVVPFVLQHLPQALGDLLGWIMERIKLLEKTDREGWPANGLHLTNVVLDCISSFKNPSLVMTIQPHPLGLTQSNGLCGSLSDLKALQNSLTDIEYLETSLLCPVTLSEYESEPREVMVFKLLDKVVAAELVASTVGSKVTPYVRKHDLNLDEVLLNYTKLFLSQFPPTSGMAGSPYESKAIALVQAIQDKELHVTGCLELLRHLQPPWSETVEELVEQCLALEHSLVFTLRRQYKLLQLKKLLHGYDIRNFNFSGTKHGKMYMRRILASNQITALKDALEVADMYQLEEHAVYREHIVQLVSRDKIEAANDVLQSLPVKTRVTVAHRTLSFASCKLQLPFYPDMEDTADREGAVKLVLLSLRVLQKCSADGKVVDYCESVEAEWGDFTTATHLYKRLLALQTEYGLFLSPSELADKGKCAEILTRRVRDFLDHKYKDPRKHRQSVYRFCLLLGFSEVEVVRALVFELIERDRLQNAQTLCWALVKADPRGCPASLLLAVGEGLWKKMKSDPGGVTKEEVEDCRTMASIAVASCNGSLLHDAIEVYDLCTFLSYLYSQCADTDDPATSSNTFFRWSWSQDHRYREEGLVLDRETVLPLAAQCASTRLPKLPWGGGWDDVRPLHPRRAYQAKQDLDTTLDTQLRNILKDSGHTQLSFRYTATTLSMLGQQDATLGTDLLQQEIMTFLTSLTTKVLSSRRLDHTLSLALLLMCPPSEVMPHLRNIKTGSASSYSRVIGLCQLSIDYSIIMGLPAIRQEAMTILKSAKWGKELGQHKVAYTEAFRGGLEERKKVASVLLRCQELDLETVVKYCSEEVGQKPQSVLLTYLRVILTQWEDQYEARAAEVMKDITNSGLLTGMFSSLLQSKVSPYNYRKIAFFLQFLKKQKTPPSLKVAQGLLVLDCLRYYQRVSAPGKYELEWYRKNQTKDQQTKGETLPVPGAEVHLPFHPLLYGNPMEVLVSEASVNTIEKLTTIARILKLPMDDFYSACIENMILSHVTPSPLPSFADICPLLERMQDKAQAAMVAKWLVGQLQEEQDKTRALKMALTFATQCREMAKTEPEQKSADDMVGLLETMLALNQTQGLLREHRLDQPEYLNLWGHELIVQLYTDIPVASPAGRAIPPVHSIAAQVANLSKISLEKVRNKLYEQWLLSFTNQKQDMDLTQVSLMEDPTEEDTSGSDDEDKLNMKRLVYLLKVPDKLESYSKMLLNWARGSSSLATCVSRVRALQVLFVIATPAVIESVSGSSIADIRDYMQGALFVCELESLHISTTLLAFQNCKKEGLVKTLWRNHSHQPKGVRLIAELCLYYSIGDSELWGRTLNKLYDLAMLSYLRYVLKRLASRSQDLKIPGLSAIWQKTLTAPFETVSLPLSLFQKEECDESLAMLQECPFPLELDIGNIIEDFSKVGLVAHALSCIPMLPWQLDRDKYSKLVLEHLMSEKYVEVLTQVDTEMLGSQQAKELVYLHLDSCDRHEVLLGSGHFTDFVNFLVSRKKINRLLLKCMQADRLQEAVQLVEMYYTQHSVPIPTDITGKELLKEYMSQQNDLHLQV